MTVDMHEYKFLVELGRLPRFAPPSRVDPEVSAVPFPSWRAPFTALLLWHHSTGYRLPSFEHFLDHCRRVYTHPQHRGRFERWFRDPDLPRTIARIKAWYESGLAETYLYVCLVDAFEDILREGVVLYDTRADWKQKWDVAVVVRAGKFRVDAYWGDDERRGAVRADREVVERERKARTAASAHWDNRERPRWTELAISRSAGDCQDVNGVRLFSIRSINALLGQMYARAGLTEGYFFPEEPAARQGLYRWLTGTPGAPPLLTAIADAARPLVTPKRP